MTKSQKIIFIVDDSNSNLVACKNILKSHYAVYTVLSAEKMFSLMEHVIPDLILLDVDMPEMNGYEIAGRLKKNNDFRKIPFVFLSSRADVTSEMFGLNMGAMDYMHKPVVSELLLRRIEMYLSLVDYQKLLEEELLEIKTKEAAASASATTASLAVAGAETQKASPLAREIRLPLKIIIDMLDIAAKTDDTLVIKDNLNNALDTAKHLFSLINLPDTPETG